DRAMSAERIEQHMTAIREAAERQVDVAKVVEGFAQGSAPKATKGEAEAIIEQLAGAPAKMLPGGNNTWQLSNVLSWLAQGQQDGERRAHFEELAGSYLKLPKAA